MIIYIFVILCAGVDAVLLIKGIRWKSHVMRVIIRGVVIFAISYPNPIIMVSNILIFGALFDQLLNLFWGKPLFRIGTTSWWDKFWQKYPHWMLPAKIIFLTIGVYLSSYK